MDKLFQSDCTILHSHQPYMRVPISLHFCQHLLSVFLILAILVDVKWYLIMVLFCISVITNNGEYLFMCLFISFSYLFFGKMSIQIFFPFGLPVGLFSSHWVIEMCVRVCIRSGYESFTWYMISNIYSQSFFGGRGGACHTLRDLSSPTRDLTRIPCSGSTES